MTITTNLILIPQAVVDYLNASVGSFDSNFIASRLHAPTLELKDFTDLRVHVLTASKIIEVDSRGSTHSTITVPVIIKKRLNKDKNQSEIDSLIQFVDSIVNFLIRKTLPSTKFTCMGSVYNAIADGVDLQEQNVFTSALTLTYFDGNRA